MEKHHFQDRTIETTQYNKIHIGDYVLICEKQAQSYAKNLEDLTYGRVITILTKHDHPRGIKVRIITVDGEYKVGRIVYLIKDGERLTK